MPRRRTYDASALEALLIQQDRLVTHAQLRGVGFLVSTAIERCRGRGWQRILPGVICTQSGSITPRQRARAALLFGGSGSMLTGAAALDLYGLRRGQHQQSVHLLVPNQRKRTTHSFVVVERTIRLPVSHQVQDLAAAPVARAVFDACRRTETLDDVRAILADAVQQRRTTVTAVAEELRLGQIRGTALLRRAVGEVADGIRSVPEARARQLIRLSSRLPLMFWNPTITDSDGRFLLRPDGWMDEVAVAWEIDSLAWHLRPADYAATLARHNMATSLGIIVVHHTPSQLERSGERCVAELEATYLSALRRPRPNVHMLSAAA